jgi:DNA polymerase-3 subunit gamma/tau
MLLVKIATLDRTQDLEEILGRIGAFREKMAQDRPRPEETEETGPVRSDSDPAGISGEVREISESGWKSFLDHVRDRRPSLASVLEQGRFMECGTGERLRLAFPSRFHMDVVGDRDQTRALEALCTEFFGRSVRIVPVLDSQPVNRENHVRQQQHQVQVEVKSHPLVQEALELFGGQIVEIRTTDQPREDSGKSHSGGSV